MLGKLSLKACFFLQESSSFITYLQTENYLEKKNLHLAARFILQPREASFVSHLNNIVVNKEVPLAAVRTTIKSKYCRGPHLNCSV